MTIAAIEKAIEIVQDQTRRIRKRLHKNRSRMIYAVQNDDGLDSRVYSKVEAVVLAAKYGAWIYAGRQKAGWIKAGELTGCHWQKNKVWYLANQGLKKNKLDLRLETK